MIMMMMMIIIIITRQQWCIPRYAVPGQQSVRNNMLQIQDIRSTSEIRTGKFDLRQTSYSWANTVNCGWCIREASLHTSMIGNI
jgi:hypothetical protein